MLPTKETQSVRVGDLDAPERYRWIPKADVIDVLKLQPGMTIAEIGAGAGDLIQLVSEAIGWAGHAFAVETAPEMLASLREKAQGHLNIRVVEAPHDATPIASGSCDRVLMANLWAELPDPMATLREAARLLRKDGRLVVIEWQADAEYPHAPRRRIGLHEMVRLLEKNSWDLHRHGEIGPYSYFLEAAVTDESVQS